VAGDFDDMTKLIRVSIDKQYCWVKKNSEHVREGSERKIFRTEIMAEPRGVFPATIQLAT